MNIELPKDAEGREIPLNTTALYGMDGEGLNVRHFEFNPISGEWIIAALKDGPSNWGAVYRSPQNVHLEKPAPPDSWEKLLDDLDNAANAASRNLSALCCTWFNDDNGCADCPADQVNDETCGSQFINDIAARIRKLAAKEG